ncbi:unnamed protein product, partial [Didymodactylos carnosus]
AAGPTSQDLYDACKQNDSSTVQKFLPLMTIESIDRPVTGGSTSLHVAAYYGHNDLVKLLLASGASATQRNIAHGLTPYEEARTESTKALFRSENQTYRLTASDDIHIEWSSIFHDTLEKATYIRQKLLQFSSVYDQSRYGPRFELQALVTGIHTYIDTLPLLKREPEIVKNFFTKFFETNDPTFILKAYTSPNTSFYKYLNQHIAMYAVDFFDFSTVDLSVDYRIVRVILDIIAIIMHGKEFHRFRFTNQETYRGMLMTEEDLYKYIVGSTIMNKSFLSTTLRRETAETWSGGDLESFLRKTPDHKPIHIATLCTYIVKNLETALDIHTLSEASADDEQEVLILPFSVFEVKNVIRKAPNKVEIVLEEYVRDQTFLNLSL